MKNFHRILILFFIGNFPWLLASCSEVFYAPTSHNVPLFREKNEIHATAAGINTDEASGFEANAAYSVTNSFAIIANGAYLTGGGKGSPSYGTGYLGEVGTGYFKPFSENATFEVFAGGGIGKVSYPNKYPESWKLSFKKYFIQPAIGYSGKVCDIAFSPKFSLISYKHGLPISYIHDGNGNVFVKTKDNFLAFEPALTFRLGRKYTKLQVQLIHSIQDIPQGNQTSISGGLHITLAPRFKTN